MQYSSKKTLSFEMKSSELNVIYLLATTCALAQVFSTGFLIVVLAKFLKVI